MDWDPFSRRPRRQGPFDPYERQRRLMEEERRRRLLEEEARRRMMEEEALRRMEEEERRQMEARKRAAPPPPPEPRAPEPATAPESRLDRDVIEQFEKELAAAHRERDEWADKYQHTLAETQNMRQRLQRNAEERAFEENRATLRRFLAVADNLERALAAGSAENDALLNGVRMTYEQLQRALVESGVTPIPTIGSDFDPNYHEAVAAVPRPDTAPGTIVDEVEKGYTFQDRLLRPARVVIAQ